MPRAIVIGAGLGGLSTAIHLASRGWQVSLFEKNAQPGGRMSTVTVGPYTWDAGPTLVMMPQVLRALFGAAGRRLGDGASGPRRAPPAGRRPDRLPPFVRVATPGARSP